MRLQQVGMISQTSASTSSGLWEREEKVTSKSVVLSMTISTITLSLLEIQPRMTSPMQQFLIQLNSQIFRHRKVSNIQMLLPMLLTSRETSFGESTSEMKLLTSMEVLSILSLAVKSTISAISWCMVWPRVNRCLSFSILMHDLARYLNSLVLIKSGLQMLNKLGKVNSTCSKASIMTRKTLSIKSHTTTFHLLSICTAIQVQLQRPSQKMCFIS